MKRKFTIEVDIDTEAEGRNQARMSGSLCQILVRKDEIDYNPISVVAHELGHVIGHMFKLPKYSEDPRIGFVGTTSPPEYYQKILASETEAWDVAETLFILRCDRAKALRTYTNDPAGVWNG